MAKPKVTEDQIREAAYLKWLEDGAPQGKDQDYWFKAEADLGATPTKAPARKAAAKKPSPKAAGKTTGAKKTPAKKPAAKKPAAKKVAAKA